MASPPSQKPILLQGHERSITQIKYNREGDLLFTVAKDPVSLVSPTALIFRLSPSLIRLFSSPRLSTFGIR